MNKDGIDLSFLFFSIPNFQSDDNFLFQKFQALIIYLFPE